MERSSAADTPPLPKTFVLELTRRCNHRCRHCYAVWGQAPARAAAGVDHELTSGQLIDTVARLLDEVKVENVALSGGEPLLREDLPEILGFLRRRDIAPTVITNGRLLTPEKLDAVKDAGAFEITLFSYRREIHDHLAGCPGAWDAAVNAMANLRQAGRDFVAVFVAGSLNCRDLPKTVELAIALGAYGLMYNRVNLTPQLLAHNSDLLPTPEMLRENLNALELAGEKYGLPVAVSVVIEPCVLDTRQYRHIHFGWCPLAAEDSYFTLDPSGDLRICNHSPVVLGNIRRGGFTDIYRRHPRVKAFRETWPAECADCAPELKKMCGGGCKAAAEQCYGTLERVDPFVTWCNGRRQPAAAKVAGAQARGFERVEHRGS